MSHEWDIPSAKVVLLGESGAGKTSIALRFSKNEFNPYTESTIGTSFLTKTIFTSKNPFEDESDHDTRQIQLNIWDTAGEEKFHSITPMYYRGSQAAILIYDICDNVSFESIHRWVDELANAGPADLLLVVCGNKFDLDHRRVITRERGEGYAHTIGALYMETSARDGSNVDILFEKVGKDLRERIVECEGDDDMVIPGDDDIIDLRDSKNRQWYCC